MGKLKQSLIDTDQEDQTDPRGDMPNPAEEAALAEQEIGLGWALFDLKKAAATIAANPYGLTVGDLQDISQAVLKLQAIPRKVNKPF